jgi:hypothetical protein
MAYEEERKQGKLTVRKLMLQTLRFPAEFSTGEKLGSLNREIYGRYIFNGTVGSNGQNTRENIYVQVHPRIVSSQC